MEHKWDAIYDMEADHETRSYFDSQQIAFELSTSYNEGIVEIQAYDYDDIHESAQDKVKNELAITRKYIPDIAKWELRDGHGTILASDDLLYVYDFINEDTWPKMITIIYKRVK